MAIHARATRLVQSNLVLKYMDKHLTLPLDREALQRGARGESFWCYAIGVALVMINRYKFTGGIEIEILKSTLPICKGLSSSAAVCVVVARAFNRIYLLSLSTQGEMEIAYSGERACGSLCGTMDQAVAFGPGSAVVMHFDGDSQHSESLKVCGDSEKCIYLVYADLKSSKDTKTILQELQRAYPFPQTDKHIALHAALGEENKKICEAALAAIHNGDAKQLGELMIQAQELFDNAAMPMTNALKSPKLHTILKDTDIQALVFGGKGVGSQGDGTVQFVARSLQHAYQLVHILNHEKKCCDATIISIGKNTQPLSLITRRVPNELLDAASPIRYEFQPHVEEHQNESRVKDEKKVKRVVIPVAGLGTRLYPISANIRPKSMLPILDVTNGPTTTQVLKPLLLYLLEDCLVRCDFEQVIVVATPGEEEQRVNEMLMAPSEHMQSKLKPEQLEYAFSIQQWRDRVHVVGHDTNGFGHAVQLSLSELQGESFMLLLGDVMLYPKITKSPSAINVVKNVFLEFEAKYCVLGVYPVSKAEAENYGCVNGKVMLTGSDGYKVLSVDVMVEKPKTQQEMNDLHVDKSICEDAEYLAVLGPYLFTNNIASKLNGAVSHSAFSKNRPEIQLTPYIKELVDEKKVIAVLLSHIQPLDVGLPLEYCKTLRYLMDSHLTQ
ncbi:UTP-glucose-1-phosphate uridylyltransferase [Acrasis kona]|uniref:UTP--glucose-1-phosphate uridylyltransferase n=1 Tax=Acrasis kona TaxID=1008807 RepID=A0AAW2Z3F3_9EUKA